MKRSIIWQGVYMIVGVLECFLLSITTTILIAPYFDRLWLLSPAFTQLTGLSKEAVYNNFYINYYTN